MRSATGLGMIKEETKVEQKGLFKNFGKQNSNNHLKGNFLGDSMLKNALRSSLTLSDIQGSRSQRNTEVIAN